MTARNDITGDLIKTKATMGQEFEDNFNKIFGKKKTTNGGWTPPPLEIKTEEEEEFFERGKEIAREADRVNETHKILKRETKWEGDPINLAKPTSTPTQPAEYAEDWQSSERDKAIAQNGNVGYTEDQVNE